MASRLLTLRGERSRYLGADASTGDPVVPATNLASDVYETAERRSGVVQRLVSTPAPLGPTRQVRDLVRGYAAGFNRYLTDTGVARLPDPTCRGAAWVSRMTEFDVYQNMYDINELFGSQEAITQIATAAPPAAGSAESAAPALTRATTPGSNAIGLGRDATRGRGGMLLGNPHFPWAGPYRFYQMQLTIPGQIDVSGAALFGVPVVMIGHTARLAWSHTSDTASHVTLYRLTLAAGDPTSYVVDGRSEPMTRREISVPAGAGSSVTRTVYYTRYGPVLADGWSSTTAYALRDANAGNLRSMNMWLSLGQANSVAGLRAAQDRYQAAPWVNTVAADSTGTSYYADAAVVPHVTDAQLGQCLVDDDILDGSTAACAWGSDADAIEPAIYGPAEIPRLSRTDYVTNSNESPWLTNPQAPLTGYPKIFGDAGTVRSLRTRLGLDMVAGRLAGTDGLGAPGFDLPLLQQSFGQNRDLAADLLKDQLAAYCAEHPTLTASDGRAIDVSTACPVLTAWDGRYSPSSRGAVLWREFLLGASLGGPPTPGGNLFKVPFSAAEPVTTPRDLNTSNPGVGRALANAVEKLTRLNVPLDEPLSAAQHASGFAVPGCSGPEGCFNVAAPAAMTLGSTGAYPDVTFGSTFVMAVTLAPGGVQAGTILTYSESADPTSPHHTDQTALYSRGLWVNDPFSAAAIAADPGLQVRRLVG